MLQCLQVSVTCQCLIYQNLYAFYKNRESYEKRCRCWLCFEERLRDLAQNMVIREEDIAKRRRKIAGEEWRRKTKTNSGAKKTDRKTEQANPTAHRPPDSGSTPPSFSSLPLAGARSDTRCRLILWLLSFPHRCSRTPAPAAHSDMPSRGWPGQEEETGTGVGGRGEEGAWWWKRWRRSLAARMVASLKIITLFLAW